MGYSTYFSLRVDKPSDVLVETRLIEDLGRDFENVFTDSDTIYANTHSKWYAYEADMCKLSLNYPGLLFFTEGSGEENGDLWHYYVRDGKSQWIDAEITYAPFNPELMQ